MKEYKFGKIAGLSLVALLSFFAGTFLLWLALCVVGIWNLKLPLLQAIIESGKQHMREEGMNLKKFLEEQP